MTQETALVLGALALVTLALLWNALVETPRRERQRATAGFKALATAVELRYPSHGRLTDRVVELSSQVGIARGLRGKELDDLVDAAYLRDVGMTSLPYSLVNKAHARKWTEEDYELYFSHAEIGANMLDEIPSLRKLARIVRYHHTPFDRGEKAPHPFEIPIEARILRVATDYAWYERSQGAILARERLRDGAGVDYDPELVTLLIGEFALDTTHRSELVPA